MLLLTVIISAGILIFYWGQPAHIIGTITAAVIALPVILRMVLYPSKKFVKLGRGYLLGREQWEKPIRLSKKELAKGMMVLGSPGSGKTKTLCLMLQQLNNSSKSVIFCDGKGDLAIPLSAQALDHPFDYVLSTELETSSTINICSGATEDIVERLGIMLTSHTLTTDYHRERERSILRSLIPVLRQINEKINLYDIQYALDNNCYAALREEAKKRKRHLRGLDRLREILYKYEGQQMSERVGSLTNKISHFTSGKKAGRYNDYSPDINITDLIHNGKNLYCHLPLSDTAKMIGIAMIEMLKIEQKRRQAKLGQLDEIYAIFDDWGGIFHEEMKTLLARARAARMAFIFAYQSLGQISEPGSTLNTDLADTLSNKLFLRIDGAETARYAAEQVGTTEKMMMSRHTKRFHSESQTVSEQVQFDVESHTIQNLKTGNAFLINLEKGKRKKYFVEIRNVRDRKMTEIQYKHKEPDLTSGLNIAKIAQEYKNQKQKNKEEYA